MKRLMFLLLLLLSLDASAQKKPLDHSVYDSWQSISGCSLSDDGRFAAYRITPQEGDATLVIRELASGREISIERGGKPYLSKDGKWAAFIIKAPFAETRKARIAKKKDDDMPKDSVAWLNLETYVIQKRPAATSLEVSFNSHNVLSYTTGSKNKKKLVVIDPESGRCDSLMYADKFSFSYNGDRLAVSFKKKKSKKDSVELNELAVYGLPSMEREIISKDWKYYGKPKFNDAGDKLVFLASNDTARSGNKHCSLNIYEESVKGRGKNAVVSTSVRELIPADYEKDGLCLTENSNPRFSRLSSRIFLSIAECLPPDDTTIVSFETASLDIWNYDQLMTPPMQKARMSEVRMAGYDAVINLKDDPGRIVRLDTSLFDRISFVDGGEADWILLSNSDKYKLRSTWDGNSAFDLYKVNLADGSRTTLMTGEDGRGRLSPEGKYFVWYSNADRNWYSLRIADGSRFNLTGNIDGTFYDDEDDHPRPAQAVDSPHWIEGDEAFLLADKYDIFKIRPDGGGAVNLSSGKGRANNVQYRYKDIDKNNIRPALSEMGVKKSIGRKETVILTAFDRTDKKNGFASVSVAKAGLLNSFTDGFSYPSILRAGRSVVFLKGNFNAPNDVYAASSIFGQAEKLSSINPQQALYNWGDVRLVHWKAYDGTELDGLLYTPENLDPEKKYPMMIYFYEKNSENLYSYRAPAPSRSTVNVPFYVSRGYVFFIPDIVYTTGHPGESAYNCICSGAEAMCRQFGFIDSTKMAIQGQSWGGYQTAYLVTRTDMFAAAGAGAPVGNMTSAYGGVRWESGNVRAVQYEHGQSRIGASLWDDGALDLYIENSPVFHTRNVTTPVLIMHNDADGAVPWYQGIEFFMALRRFEHPAWLLQYNNEAHNLKLRKNCKDLSIRLQQFFDHYLLGAPEPAWMKNGVPQTRKGQYFGYELLPDED